jgi:hypothetical protein
MEIHLSEKFSQIEVVHFDGDLVAIQSSLWPSWSELNDVAKEKLSAAQLQELEDLFRTENLSRKFEIEDQVLKIRLA